MRLLDRLLSTGGADGISTILDDLDINDLLADSLGDLPGGADRDLVAGSDGNTVAEGSRCSNWASITISSIGISISISISLSFTLSVPSSNNTSNNTSNNGTSTNSADNNASGDNLGVLAYDSRAVSALGAGLPALGGDNL